MFLLNDMYNNLHYVSEDLDDTYVMLLTFINIEMNVLLNNKSRDRKLSTYQIKEVKKNGCRIIDVYTFDTKLCNLYDMNNKIKTINHSRQMTLLLNKIKNWNTIRTKSDELVVVMPIGMDDKSNIDTDSNSESNLKSESIHIDTDTDSKHNYEVKL